MPSGASRLLTQPFGSGPGERRHGPRRVAVQAGRDVRGRSRSTVEPSAELGAAASSLPASHDRTVRVTLVCFDGCPNWQLTDERLSQAVARLGRDDVTLEHRRVTTPEEAETLGFRGSPTVLGRRA